MQCDNCLGPASHEQAQAFRGLVLCGACTAGEHVRRAAPELLAALKVMVAWTAHAFDADDPDMDLPELEQARAAIAKAEPGALPPPAISIREELDRR